MTIIGNHEDRPVLDQRVQVAARQGSMAGAQVVTQAKAGQPGFVRVFCCVGFQ